RGGAEPRAERGVPPAAGRSRREPRAVVAVRPARRLSDREARAGDGALGRRGDDRTDPRAVARWLAHRLLRLALGLLHQPAVRADGLVRRVALRARDPDRARPALRPARIR